MSATQVIIEPCDLNCPPISFYSTDAVRAQYPLLSKLELPLLFGAPEPFFSDEAIATALLSLGHAIEESILQNAETAKLEGFYLFCKHVLIRLNIDVTPDDHMVPSYLWQICYLKLMYDQRLPVRDLYGHRYLNLTSMLAKIQPEH